MKPPMDVSKPESDFNPNTEGVPAPHLTEEGGAHYAPPLKSPKSNIFGQGKLGLAITYYY